MKSKILCFLYILFIFNSIKCYNISKNTNVKITETKSIISSKIKQQCDIKRHLILITDSLTHHKILADTTCDFDDIHNKIRIPEFWNYERKMSGNPSNYLYGIDSIYHKTPVLLKNTESINKVLKYYNVIYKNFHPKDTSHLLYTCIKIIDSIDTQSTQIYSNYHKSWETLVKTYNNKKYKYEYTGIALRKERFRRILQNQYQVNKFIMVCDGNPSNIASTKFFFEYTYYADKEGCLQISKKLLNPEAALHLCE